MCVSGRCVHACVHVGMSVRCVVYVFVRCVRVCVLLETNLQGFAQFKRKTAGWKSATPYGMEDDPELLNRFKMLGDI